MRGALVTAEVALSLVLLVGAGLMLRTLAWLNGLNPGFDTHNVIAAEASLQDASYQTAEAVNRLYTETLERIRRIPAVQSAAVALTLPYERPLNNRFLTVDGDDRDPQQRRVAMEDTLPEGMTQDRYGYAARHILLAGEFAAPHPRRGNSRRRRDAAGCIPDDRWQRSWRLRFRNLPPRPVRRCGRGLLRTMHRSAKC
jgi:hypothetical protein